jgi:hypothetical protein
MSIGAKNEQTTGLDTLVEVVMCYKLLLKLTEHDMSGAQRRLASRCVCSVDLRSVGVHDVVFGMGLQKTCCFFSGKK